MPWRRWIPFLQGLEPDVRRVTRLPDDLRSLIGASASSVYLRHDYAVKCMQKHGLRAEHFPMLELTIDLGMVVQDRPSNLTFFYSDGAVFGTWFHVSIKTTGETDELFVKTFHKTSPQEVRRLCRKYPVVRGLKA